MAFTYTFKQQVEALTLAEISFKLWKEDCPKNESFKEAVGWNYKNNSTESLACFNERSDQKRLNLLKNDLGEISENTFLATLAKEKSDALDCGINQLKFLKDNPNELKQFISDYKSKLILLGNEKRLLNDLRNLPNKTQADKDAYDLALRRSELILQSLPFSQIRTFQKIISYTVQQYDSYTSDRLETWLPGQLDNLLNKAVYETEKILQKDKSIVDAGVSTLGKSLDDAEKESLAQDAGLIEIFKERNRPESLQMSQIMCRVDAKYGTGAVIRDRSLFALSLLSIPATGLVKAGAGVLGSSVTGAYMIGQFSLRSAGVLRLLSAAGLTAASLSQIQKSCFAKYTEVASAQHDQTSINCDSNILKSQEHDNCLLIAGLNALGFQATHKALRESLSSLKSFSNAQVASDPLKKFSDFQQKAIQEAHLVGRGEQGLDGSLAKKGNYTYRQKLKKSRILKDAKINKTDRRKLFEDGVVGDADDIEQLIDIEEKILQLENYYWKNTSKSKVSMQEIKQLRADFDAAMEDSSNQVAGHISKIRDKIDKLTVAGVQADQTAQIDDLILNPAALLGQKVIVLNAERKSTHQLKFEDSALGDFLKAEKPIIQKFINSIKSGSSSESFDPTKIKILSGLEAGKQGKAFEVRIINHGHQRLFGCYQNGILTVMKYDSHAPESYAGTVQRYKDLCR